LALIADQGNSHTHAHIHH